MTARRLQQIGRMRKRRRRRGDFGAAAADRLRPSGQLAAAERLLA